MWCKSNRIDFLSTGPVLDWNTREEAEVIMWSGKYLRLVGGLVSVGIGIIIIIATLAAMGAFVSTVEYDLRVADGDKTGSAEAVEDFLLSSGWLPQPGTGLARHTDDLAWAAVPDDLTRKITNVTVRQVKITSGDSLLMSLLDDDPTCMAKVDAIATTADGQKTHLTVRVWDYCLLTPWSFHIYGDGWKPVGVQWKQVQGGNE